MENNHPINEQKIKNELKKLDRYAFYIGILGIISMFVFTVLATQLHIWFDYTNTGQIGDTIGGLTAPIIGLFSALLIYLSFRAQIKANYIVQEQINQQRKEDIEKKEFSYQMEVYRHLKEVIEKFECIDERHNGTTFMSPKFQGYDALKTVLRNLGNNEQNLFSLGSNYHRFIHSVLSQFDSLIESFQNPKNQDHDIRLPLQLVEFLFYDRFWSYVDKAVINAHENREGKFEDVLRIYNRLYRIEQKISFISQAEELRQQGHDVLRG